MNAMGTPSTRWKFTGTLIVRPLRRPLKSSNMTPLMRLPKREDSTGLIRTFMPLSTAGGGGGENRTLPFASAMAAAPALNKVVSMKLRRWRFRRQNLRHG